MLATVTLYSNIASFAFNIKISISKIGMKMFKLKISMCQWKANEWFFTANCIREQRNTYLYKREPRYPVLPQKKPFSMLFYSLHYG